MQNLREAVEQLDRSDGISVRKRSSVYETEPVGEILDQRDFFNAVVQIETSLTPLQLLDCCKSIETEFGRDLDAARHSPRPIDIDLLSVAGTQMSNERLTLPHPEATSRRFVLEPLLEIDPKLRLPGGEDVSIALRAIGEAERVQRVASL